MKIKILLLTILYLPNTTFANSLPIESFNLLTPFYTENKKGAEQNNEQSFLSLDRLRSFDGTYVGLDYFQYDNDLERAVDVQYSFMYLFSNPELYKLSINEKSNSSDWDYNFAFSFTGEFDFYMGSRFSGPVVGRRYNPGIQFFWNRKIVSPTFLQTTDFGFSIEHESNGQTTHGEGDEGVTVDYLPSIADDFKRINVDYANSSSDAYYIEMATETISRGYNFIAFYAHHFIGTVKGWTLLAGWKLRYDEFTSADDRIFWDDNYSDSKFINHKGTKLGVYARGGEYTKPFEWLGLNQQAVSVEYRTGQLLTGDAFDKHTLDVTYMVDLVLGEDTRIPLFVKYHNGYLDEVFNYHIKQEKWLFGFHMNF